MSVNIMLIGCAKVMWTIATYVEKKKSWLNCIHLVCVFVRMLHTFCTTKVFVLCLSLRFFYSAVIFRSSATVEVFCRVDTSVAKFSAPTFYEWSVAHRLYCCFVIGHCHWSRALDRYSIFQEFLDVSSANISVFLYPESLGLLVS